MLQTWKEIVESFNRLKDHKPRSPKKLKELGELLASAYVKLPDKANEMWKYIVNLNTADNIGYAQYYVAQVYRKLVFELGPAQATKFLAMDCQRIHLLFHYGYDGLSFYHCVYYVLGYYIIKNDLANAQVVIDELQQKYANQSIQLDEKVQALMVSVVTDLSLTHKKSKLQYNDPSDLHEYHGAKVEEVSAFCNYCITKYPNTYMAKILQSYNALITEKAIDDPVVVSDIFDQLLTHHELAIYADFLYLEREVVPQEINKRIQDYVTNSPQRLPLDFSNEDNLFHVEEKKWYQERVRNSPELLTDLFSNHNGHIDGFPEKYLNSLVEQEQWRLFTKYLSMAIAAADSWRLSSCITYIENCMNYYVYGEGDELPNSHYKKIACITISAFDIFESLGISTVRSGKTVIPKWKGRLSVSAAEKFIQSLDDLCQLIEGTEQYHSVLETVNGLKGKYKEYIELSWNNTCS